MDLYLGWPWLSAEVCPPSPCGLSWSMYGWDKAPAAQTSQWLLGVHIMMLLICLSFLVCYVAVFGMLTEEMAAAHSWDWGIQSQNTLMSLLWVLKVPVSDSPVLSGPWTTSTLVFWEYKHCTLPQMPALYWLWNGRKWRKHLGSAWAERAKPLLMCSRTNIIFLML